MQVLLFNKELRMLFEVHITVDSREIERWKACCQGLGIKPLFIKLSRGKHQYQLLSASTFRGNREGADDYVSSLHGQIKSNGFASIRTKLECSLDKIPGGVVPAYFECHIKFPLIKHGRGIKTSARKTQTAASENLLACDGSLQKWYLTTRHYFEQGQYNRRKMSDENYARYKFEDIGRKVRVFLPVRSIDMECVIYDTNPVLDEDWVE